MYQARQLLSDDHEAVHEVLQQLLTALNKKDVQTSHAKLDLLWARLAVHIRAEHLHLFPALASESSETQSIIDNLRADHDFFMRELAKAIGVIRELPSNLDNASDEAKWAAVADAVREIEKRLASHNEIEENRIYHLASTILSEPAQMELSTRINAELENRPPRFSAEAWADK
ncbi:MAG TPA: hemerythrin domain-containing protein [Pyrinomonadaceae bacterium]|nr:hemerythrin domain-containing protein [Pyrinomonadaceae bacterium]